MENNITFYYFYWESVPGAILGSLVLSIIHLKNVYPHNSIKIVSYTKINDSMKFVERELDVKFIYIDECFLYNKQKNDVAFQNFQFFKNNYEKDNLSFLISKPVDCYDVAKKENDKNICLIDVDFFVFDQFENIDFSKVGFYVHNYQNVEDKVANTGLVFFGINKKTEMFLNLYCNTINYFNHNDEELIQKTITNVYGFKNPLQEEILFTLVYRYFKEYIGILFYELHQTNHIIYLKLDHSIKKIKNIHFTCVSKIEKIEIMLSLRLTQNLLLQHGTLYNKFLSNYKKYIPVSDNKFYSIFINLMDHESSQPVQPISKKSIYKLY